VDERPRDKKPNPEYDFHPVCVAFSAYKPEVYAKRLEDYRRHPERAGDTAVLLAKDEADGAWKVADGRHHYLICQDIGYECEFQRFTGTPKQLGELVIARNYDRRHDDPSQLAASIVLVMEWVNGGNRKGDQSPPGDSDRKANKSQEATAKDAGIGKNTLKRAAKVKAKAPELLPAMRDGKLDAKTAEKVADLPEAKRKKIAAADDVKKAAKEELAKAKPKTPAAGTGKKAKPAVTPPAAGEGGTFSLADGAGDDEGENAPDPVKTKEHPAPEVDGWGIPIQGHAAAAFADVTKFKALLAVINQAKRLFNELADSPGGKFLTVPAVASYHRTGKDKDGTPAGRWVHPGLDRAFKQVQAATPTYTVCPYRYADLPHEAGCSTCCDLDWTPALGDSIPPVTIERAKKAHAA
jgi:hypothetical protein